MHRETGFHELMATTGTMSRDLSDPALYVNREFSWLDFNARVLALAADTHPIQREFFDFYRTPRGEFTPRGASPRTTTQPTLTSNVKFMNFYPFNDIETISPRPLLIVQGEKDTMVRLEEGETLFANAGEPKDMMIIPDINHAEVYEPRNPEVYGRVIARLLEFYRANLA